MIQKFTNENILLIPDVIYKDKDKYDYEWLIDKDISLYGYEAFYSFDKPGVHEVQLIVVDKLSTISSVYTNQINITDKQQSYLPFDASDNNGGFGIGTFSHEDFGD